MVEETLYRLDFGTIQTITPYKCEYPHPQGRACGWVPGEGGDFLRTFIYISARLSATAMPAKVGFRRPSSISTSPLSASRDIVSAFSNTRSYP